MFHPGYRLVARTNTAVTRPALERAGWRCERCPSDDNLRVIEHHGTIMVVCDSCRVKVGQPVSTGKPKFTKVAKIEAKLDEADRVRPASSMDFVPSHTFDEVKPNDPLVVEIPDLVDRIASDPELIAQNAVRLAEKVNEPEELEPEPDPPLSPEGWMSYTAINKRKAPDSNALWVLRHLGPFSTEALLRHAVVPETLEKLIASGQIERTEQSGRTYWCITAAYEKYLLEEERQHVEEHRRRRTS